MSYITPAQFRSGLQEAKDYADSVAGSGGSGGGGGSTSIVKAYIVGTDAGSSAWLSLTEGGVPLTPNTNFIYAIQTKGDYYRLFYMWNGKEYIIVGEKVNIGKKQSTEVRSIFEDNLRVLQSEHVYTMEIEPYVKMIIFSFTTSGAYNPDLTVGFSDQLGTIDRNTIGTKSYTHRLLVTPQDWGRTYYVNPRHITSGGSAGFTIDSSSLTIIKELEVDDLNYQPPTNTEDGKSGLIPKALAGESNKILFSDGLWHDQSDIMSIHLQEMIDATLGDVETLLQAI